MNQMQIGQDRLQDKITRIPYAPCIRLAHDVIRCMRAGRYSSGTSEGKDIPAFLQIPATAQNANPRACGRSESKAQRSEAWRAKPGPAESRKGVSPSGMTPGL